MNKSYHTGTRRIPLTVDPTAVAVRFREPAPHGRRRKVVAETPYLRPAAYGYEVPGESFTVYPIAAADGAPEDALKEVTKRLKADESVLRVAPVFSSGGNRLIASDRLVVGFHPQAGGVITRLEELGYTVLDQEGWDYLVQLRHRDDPLHEARKLAKEPDVAYAVPDFVEYGECRAPTPAAPPSATAPLSTTADAATPASGEVPAFMQWARGQVFADKAMDRLPGGIGSAAIRIAIVDTGVDARHLDLKPAIVGIHDATNCSKEEANPFPQDWHGTACAGLAAAVPFNDRGIRGFGGGCSILSVRVLYSLDGTWNFTSFALARGIRWAVCNGADVVSLSLEFTHEHPCVIRAIREAVEHGRRGKGCVVVAGTGNDVARTEPGVKFPARLEGVIAVAATDTQDRPVDLQSDQSGWRSAFGKEVALAAPGVDHYTTDNQGNDGGSPSSSETGDYITFDGTSSATAIVAGAAGLVLSANPELTAAQVREILCSTACKVTTVTYDASGHSEFLGTGRLNVDAAVAKALGEDPPPC